MATPVFPPRPGCDVPYVPAIEGSIPSSCLLEPPPARRYGFRRLNVPLPPSADFGCYQITGSASSTAAGHDQPGSARLRITYPKKNETKFCQPNLNLSLRFPCVPMPSTSTSLRMAPPTTPKKIQLYPKKLTPGCKWMLVNKLTIPCPQFSDELYTSFEGSSCTGELTGTYETTYLGDDPDRCRYLTTLRLKVRVKAGGGSALTVKETDGVPSVANVSKIVVPDDTLTDDGGGQVTFKPLIVRRNSGGGDAGGRRRLNLIEGDNVVLAVTDDAGDDEVDVSISSCPDNQAAFAEALAFVSMYGGG